MPEDQPTKKRLDIKPISRSALVFWIGWAVVIFIVGAITIHIRCGVLFETLAERDALLAEMTTLEEQAKEADRYEAEIKDFEEREAEILRIRDSRWLWAKKLDQIVDFIPRYISLESLKVTEAPAGRKDPNTGPTIEMDCISEGADERNISKYHHKKITNSLLWEDIERMPEWPYQLVYIDGKPYLKFKAVLVLWAKGAKSPAVAKKKPPEQDKHKLPFIFSRRSRRNPFE